MATGSGKGRRTTGTRKTTRNTRTASKSKKTSNKKNQSPGLAEEIILFVVLGISILLFLGAFGLLGSFGHIVRKILIGLYGIIGFVFPFGFFFACTSWISNKWERITKVRLISTFVLLWDLSGFFQLIFASDRYIVSLTDYFTGDWKNGGFLGGILTHFLCKFLGMAGTIVILLVVLVICVVLLTERSIFTSIKEGSEIVSKDIKRKSEYRREVSQIRDIEREERDMRRRERIEERERRKDEINAAKLEERRRKAEENRERTAQRMQFDRTDLRQNGFADAPVEEVMTPNPAPVQSSDDNSSNSDRYYEEEYYSTQYQDVDSYDEPVIEETPEEEVQPREPESMFYGSASTYSQTAFMPDTQAIIASTSDALALSEANSGIMSATKITPEVINGEMTEITDNYAADEEFKQYLKSQFSSEHKISVSENEEEKRRQEAYERDEPAEEKPSDSSSQYDEATVEDVADLYANRHLRTGKSHSISKSSRSELLPRIENNSNASSTPQEASYDEDFTELGFRDNSSATTRYDSSADESYDEEPIEDFYEEPVSFTKNDLSLENAKPAPVSQTISQGRAVKAKKNGKYKLPPVTLLDEVKNNDNSVAEKAELTQMGDELKETLHDFGLDVNIIGASRGPAVTRYEIQMPAGVSVKKITNLQNDIMMSLGAKDIRIEAPIPGKKAVGIEIPNRESTMVHFRELIDSKSFKNFDSKVAFGVGKDLSGEIVVSDIAKMPHLLIAGATGSGKSVCINTLIMSILFKAHPDDVKLIMIDPKMVELSIYNNIPHLLIPVVTDARQASAALSWCVNEMTTRYQKFSEVGVRDMKGYNSKIQTEIEYQNNPNHEYMPQIVIVVDELADLMMVAAKEVEESICRIAQLARAAGIYLILATQRPSVDVITGLIKANMPSRIAFSVTSNVDSRTILDQVGAERLLGYGDMLFYPRGYNKPSRVQGAFVDDHEVQRVVDFVRGQMTAEYNVSAEAALNVAANAGTTSSAGGSGGLVDPNNAFDELFVVAGHAVIESEKASIGMIQRKFKVGFNRAARIMDQLCDEGVVGQEEGTKPRKILMTMEQFNLMIEEKNHQ